MRADESCGLVALTCYSGWPYRSWRVTGSACQRVRTSNLQIISRTDQSCKTDQGSHAVSLPTQPRRTPLAWRFSHVVSVKRQHWSEALCSQATKGVCAEYRNSVIPIYSSIQSVNLARMPELNDSVASSKLRNMQRPTRVSSINAQ